MEIICLPSEFDIQRDLLEKIQTELNKRDVLNQALFIEALMMRSPC